MWTQFWDMNSGGGTKEPYKMIYIEAPEDEAKVIFYNRFGHSPERVSCTCCGEDYSIDSNESFEQLTGYHRGCEYVSKGREGKYIEAGDDIPNGWKKSKFGSGYENYQTVRQYKRRKDVLVIPASKIRKSEREGDVPTQGYVWM